MSVWSAAEPYDLVADFAAVVRIAIQPGAKAVLLPDASFWMAVHGDQTSYTRRSEMYRMAFGAAQPLLHQVAWRSSRSLPSAPSGVPDRVGSDVYG